VTGDTAKDGQTTWPTATKRVSPPPTERQTDRPDSTDPRPAGRFRADQREPRIRRLARFWFPGHRDRRDRVCPDSDNRSPCSRAGDGDPSQSWPMASRVRRDRSRVGSDAEVAPVAMIATSALPISRTFCSAVSVALGAPFAATSLSGRILRSPGSDEHRPTSWILKSTGATGAHQDAGLVRRPSQPRR
jgi:hypothetical protein